MSEAISPGASAVDTRDGSFFRDLVETAQDLVWQCDEGGRFTFLNGAWAATFGYRLDEMLGRVFTEFQMPAVVEHDRKTFARLLAGESVKGYQTVYVGKDGREIHLVFNAKAIRDPEGRPCGARGTAHDISDRVRMEQSLQASEEALVQALQIARLGHYVFDIRTGTWTSSPVLDAIFGISPDYERTVAGWLAIIHPDDREMMQAYLLDHVLGQRKPFDKEYRIRTQDAGEEQWVHGRGKLETGRDGELVRMIGTIRDISQERRARIAIQASEERFRAIVTSSPMGMHLYELQSGDRLVFTGANPAADRILGVANDQFVGKTIEEAFPPLVQTEVPARYRAAARHGTTWRTEQIDYHEGHISGAFEVVAFQAGPNRMVALFDDITQRKQTEAALAEERERLAVTLRSIGDGVIATDVEGRIRIMNQVAEALTGWPQQEACGLPLNEAFVIVNELTDAPCPNPVERVLETGAIVELANHTLLVARDGQRRIIADSGAPIRSASGAIVGVVLVFRDMTEKQKLIDAAQNTQRLESLGVLAGGIAHDFNNLLGGLFGFIDLARACSQDPEVSGHLDAAMEAMGRARGLTQQLLTFAKGGTPVMRVAPLPEFLVKTARFAVSGGNVTCDVGLADGLWCCRYDKNQLAQVIDNLVINAQQAMPMGGTIRVAAANRTLGEREHPLLPAGDYVCISVVDHGIGVPKEIQARIFDPFFTTKQKGSGLGLATSYSIVRRHGGVIDVESEPGKGATFRVYLPASLDATGVVEEPRPVSHTGSGRVLVMDDEPIMQRTISIALKRMGYAPVAVATGEEALAAFAAARREGAPFAALILDLTIPGAMGGRETADRIRAEDPAVPIIVASGYAEDPVVAQPGAFGVTDSLRKPFQIAELAAIMERHLGRARTTDPRDPAAG